MKGAKRMPAKRKTKSERRAEQFAAAYRIGKAVAGVTDNEVASFLGMTEPTLRRKRRNPDKLTIGELEKLSALFRWGEDEIRHLIVLA